MDLKKAELAYKLVEVAMFILELYRLFHGN